MWYKLKDKDPELNKEVKLRTPGGEIVIVKYVIDDLYGRAWLCGNDYYVAKYYDEWSY